MVICKEPIPGRVKTRMCPPLSHIQAAELARASLADTFAACAAAEPDRLVAVIEGTDPAWVPVGWEVFYQRTGGLDVRLADAFDDVLADGGRGVLVAMDTPQATPLQIAGALQQLDFHDAVIGMTDDGGYWIIGLTRPVRESFLGVPMSTDSTGQAQLDRLQSLGYSVAVVDTVRDLDTITDVGLVSDQFPHLAVSQWFATLSLNGDLL